MKKILITGATGFIGSYLCQQFVEHNYTVVATVRKVEQKKALEAQGCKVVVIGDISSKTDWSTALQNIDVVIHTAALVHQMKATSDDLHDSYQEKNALATSNIVEQAIAAKVEKFIFLSSIKVNGEKTDGTPFDEAMSPAPQDPYGLSKYRAEQLIAEKTENTTMDYAILRLPLIYGVGVKANFANLLKLVRKGYPLPFAKIHNKRSLLYLGNLSSVILACVEKMNLGRATFCLSDNDDVSTTELITKIAQNYQSKTKLFYVPKFIFTLIGAMTSRTNAIERLMGSLQVNSNEVQDALNWQPPFTVDSALKEMANEENNK